jgi:hypothetical protein
VVAAVVAGTAFAAPLLVRQAQGSSEAATLPVGATITPAGTPTAGRPSTKPGQPPVGRPTKTPVVRPSPLPPHRPGSVPVPGPPATGTAGAAGRHSSGVATTTTRPSIRNNPPAATTTQPKPPRTASGAPKPPVFVAAPAGSVPVRNVGSNRCIDVKDSQNGIGRDGTPLQLWDCAGSANQGWTFNSDGTIRSMGLCMDLAWASTADNTQVQLVNCNGGWAQKFTLNNANDLVNPTADKCVTAVGSGNGANLVLRSCAGTPEQKWHRA